MKANSKLFINAAQQGQAVCEALIVLTIFLLLMTGMQFTNSMQFSALHMLMDSAKKVFEVSLGKATTGDIERYTSTDQKISSMRNGVNKLNAELYMADPGFVKASSHASDPRWNKINIHRHSFIETGSGYAATDRAVQDRINQSRSAWRDAFELSSDNIRRVGAITSRTDIAWKRPTISLDFVQPWAGVIPIQQPIDTSGQISIPDKAWRH